MNRRRRQLTDEEFDAWREMLHGHRPSKIGAYAALIAALAALWSAVTVTVLEVIDRLTQ